MDKKFYEASENYCNELADLIERNVPAVMVSNLGFQLLVMFDNNRSVASVYPLTQNTVDIFAKDFRDKNFDMKDVSIEQCLEFLQGMASLAEETATAAVSGFNSAKAFAAPGQKMNRATQQSEREGWSQMLRETENRFENPFGEDPLGHRSMNPKEKSKSEGKRKSAIGHNFEKGSPLALENYDSNLTGSLSENQSPEILFNYLAEMLPVDKAEILDGKILGIAVDDVKIFVLANNGGFTVKSVNGAGELVQDSENFSTGDLIKFLFSVCDGQQKRAAEKEIETDIFNSSDANLQVEINDAWNVLKELAKEAGHSDDILRNKDLFDLRQGLIVSKNENVKHAKESEKAIETSGSLKGATMHGEHPVSINENRDPSRPYQSTLGNKKLVYTLNEGATLVDKNRLPKKKKLNWHPDYGIILTDESVPTNRNGLWKFNGWK